MVIIEDVSHVLCRICTNSIKYLKQAMDVSVIIINYNTRQMTAECIDSVFEKTRGIKFEIILVDNASTDGSKEFFEKDSRITYIYNSENLGFGRANNLGAKVAKGKYLFLLNSDTIIVTDNAIERFLSYMENHREIASCGGNLITQEGECTGSYGRFPSLLQTFSTIGFYRLYEHYYQRNLALAQNVSKTDIHTVDYICGADIFIRKNIFNAFDGFDEDFFMYYEETDLYWRLNNAGYKSVIIPNIKIIHFGGQSSAKNTSISKLKRSNKSEALFFRKNKPKYQFMALKVFQFTSILVHSIYWRVKSIFS